jgi:dienelactone hydrolase
MANLLAAAVKRTTAGRLLIFCVAIGVGLIRCVDAAETNVAPWDLTALGVAPRFTPDPHHGKGDVKAIFYDSVPFQGKPTRVFAYYGIPARKAARVENVPAMVLVHGGGGSAFIPWVQLWLDRGYAAIAMDTCGATSSGGFDEDGLRNHPRHAEGGPPGWSGFDQIDWPIRDQWTYQAVADVILAHSLVRSLPGVDAERTGITGISWGGYLTCIAASIDHRFKFAAPVYGCGFLGDDSVWLDNFRVMGPEKASRWLQLWDPSVYLPQAQMPFLWVDGTNDFAYPPDSLQKSYRLPKTPRTLCTRVRMPHGHGGAGENPAEIYAFAEALFRGAPPLARIEAAGRDNRKAWIRFATEAPIVRAELNYTTDLGKWQDRRWQTVAARLNAKSGKATAELPAGCTVYYFNLVDQRGLVVSSEHVEVEPGRAKPDVAR